MQTIYILYYPVLSLGVNFGEGIFDLIGGDIWKVKNVPFPHFMIDLKKAAYFSVKVMSIDTLKGEFLHFYDEKTKF